MAALTENTKLANRARLKAQRDFVKRYPDEFTAHHNQVREEFGLPPIGQGAAQLAQENAQLRREVEQLRKAQAGGTGRRARAKATA